MHVMKDCAHWPQWERPDEHDSVICDFLDRIDT
jgi:pimeloyl-ACP methyl ester carboxylesterase